MLDVVSSVPLDLIELFSRRAMDRDFSAIKLLKSFRVIKVFRLIRLAKLARLVKRWEARVSISYSVISLTKSTIGICVFCHWMACASGRDGTIGLQQTMVLKKVKLLNKNSSWHLDTIRHQQRHPVASQQDSKIP